MEKKRMSRTYLIIDGGTDDIFGFFSLGMKCMHVPDNALMFDTMCKRMNIVDGIGVAQLFLLSQMIRSDDVVNYHKSEGFQVHRQKQSGKTESDHHILRLIHQYP